MSLRNELLTLLMFYDIFFYFIVYGLALDIGFLYLLSFFFFFFFLQQVWSKLFFQQKVLIFFFLFSTKTC